MLEGWTTREKEGHFLEIYPLGYQDLWENDFSQDGLNLIIYEALMT